MITARTALLRQAQDYFHMFLLGTVPWDAVIVDKPIPVPSVRGQREQGKFRDLVIANFLGFRMELISPFEDDQWPLGRVRVERGAKRIEGPLDMLTWQKVAAFIKQNIEEGDHGETASAAASRADWGH